MSGRPAADRGPGSVYGLEGNQVRPPGGRRRPPTQFSDHTGPVFLLPTASDETLGGEKWGPTGVALRQAGPWTYGALANHIWSFAGDDNRGSVNATFLQPARGALFHLRTGDALLLPNHEWNRTCWHSVFALGRRPSLAHSCGIFAARRPNPRKGPAGAERAGA